MIYDFSHISFFVVMVASWIAKWGDFWDICDSMLGTYVNILCNWLILCKMHFTCNWVRSRMCLMFQETRFQVQVLNPCKFVQESSEKVQDFKARQLAR